eukprot:364283-Chlamydomonas_euryale.AAC.3
MPHFDGFWIPYMRHMTSNRCNYADEGEHRTFSRWPCHGGAQCEHTFASLQATWAVIPVRRTAVLGCVNNKLRAFGTVVHGFTSASVGRVPTGTREGWHSNGQSTAVLAKERPRRIGVK